MPPLKFNQLVCGVVFPCMGLNATDNLLSTIYTIGNKALVRITMLQAFLAESDLETVKRCSNV